jgi:hypothetical protein
MLTEEQRSRFIRVVSMFVRKRAKVRLHEYRTAAKTVARIPRSRAPRRVGRRLVCRAVTSGGGGSGDDDSGGSDHPDQPPHVTVTPFHNPAFLDWRCAA